MTEGELDVSEHEQHHDHDDHDDHDDHEHHAHGDVEGLSNKLNWLRAGVLGANDGIVSVAGIVMGVAGATTHTSSILIAAIAALVAGALSMGAGEYVSVSTQRDAELMLLENERHDLARMPDEEMRHLAQMLEEMGIGAETAKKAAHQIHEQDALRVHAELEFGIDVDDVTKPWGAAFASTGSFTVGGLLPALTILLPGTARYYVTAVVVTAALALTGYVSARLSRAHPRPAMARNVLGGLFAMGVTLLVGHLVGGAVA